MSGRKPREDAAWLHYTVTACSTGKRAWVERAAAKTAAETARKSGRGRMRAYLCDECDRWHIGHLPARVRAGAGW